MSFVSFVVKISAVVIETLQLGLRQVVAMDRLRTVRHRRRRLASPSAPLAGVASERHTSRQPAAEPFERRSQPRMVDVSVAAARTGLGHSLHDISY